MVLRLYPLVVFLLVLISTNFLSKPTYGNEHQPRLIELLKFTAPDTPDPYPIVVLVSGCEGFKSGGYDETEDILSALGYATARVDFMEARDAGGCAYQPTKSRIARDILFVLEYLAGMDAVNHSAVNVLAWSSGGGGALSMMSKLEKNSIIQLASVSVYYPQCNNAFPWSGDVPVLMLLGSADNMNPATFCKKLATKSPDANIQIEEYADAYHAFDDPSLPIKSVSAYGTMGYHKEAAEKSWMEVTNFLVQQ
jgi:dienelactone hydrolase